MNNEDKKSVSDKSNVIIFRFNFHCSMGFQESNNEAAKQ